ncbi:MAG: arginase family protein, partial [Chloroflexi bacterium]|nr:arginase family protein [Chloroflexota bacterium]
MTNLHDEEQHPAFVGLSTYLHLPFARDADELKASGADIAILGAPVDMGVVYRPGTRFGPRAIREASYLTASRTLYHLGLDVDPLQYMKVVDFGDANCPPSDLQLSHDAVKAKVAEALEAGTLPVVLGGDHSITLPSATAVA